MSILFSRCVVRLLFLLAIYGAIFLWGDVGARLQEGSQSDPRRPLAPEDTRSTPAEIRAVPYFSPRDPVTCELAKFYLNDAVDRTPRIKGSYVIVVARLGTGEISRKLGWQRLGIVEDYLSRYPTLNLVTAQGGRIEGFGRVEIYVGGKLLYSIPIKKNNRSICTSSGPEA